MMRAVAKALEPRLADGLFIRLRHAFPRVAPMLRAFGRPRADGRRVGLSERVLVVGLGPAAMAFLQQLKAEGFERVTVVAQDRLFGGKCVNVGCMPMEYVLAPDWVAEGGADRVREFVGRLREVTAEGFAQLGYPMVFGTAVAVEGKTLRLADGSIQAFDHLVLATGAHEADPSPPAAGVIGLEAFWSLPAGLDVVIHGEDNIAAVSLGAVAARMGGRATVLLSGRNPLQALPSYRYFIRGLKAAGVDVIEGVKVEAVADHTVAFSVKGARAERRFDHMLRLGKTTPRMLPIDGGAPSFYDVDLVQARLPQRPDITFLGDGIGLVSAAEAGAQARLLMRSWRQGERLDYRILGAMPVALHAERTLAMVGSADSLLAGKWAEVDFRALGWSLVHRHEGKLWYQLDTEHGTVRAIHICHRNAGELISVAAALMDRPVWHSAWIGSFVHPSGAEIFGLLAEQAVGALRALRPSEGRGGVALEFALPAMDDLHPSRGLPAWISPEEWRLAVLSQEPHAVFAACFGLDRLTDATGNAPRPRLVRSGPGSFAADGSGIDIELDVPARTACVRSGSDRAIVRY